MGLTYDEGTRSMFVSNLKAKMNEYNLEVVYLASPPNVIINSNELIIVIIIIILEHRFDSAAERVVPGQLFLHGRRDALFEQDDGARLLGQQLQSLIC